jgi:hypothetical protein
MATDNHISQIGFILGSPRSGTTVLGNIVDRHLHIAEWYEPDYLWSFFITNKRDNLWTKSDLKPNAVGRLRSEYEKYKRKSRAEFVVEKSPGHAFRIGLLLHIFPEAKILHLVRDGRDVTLSIHREWQKRAAIVKQKNYRALFKTALESFRRQPYLKYQVMALISEIASNRSLKPSRYLNRAKWGGKPYWGPRFENWESYLEGHSRLQFNAMQWVKCLEAVQDAWHLIPEKNRLEVRYEDLLERPRDVLTRVVSFFGYQADEAFFERIPRLRPGNTNKWRAAFTPEQIEEIQPILDPLLKKLKYLNQRPW